MAYYFVSDVHLGSQAMSEPRAVEKMFVEWLDRVADDARAIFLVGDIFDFWFEYKHVVPKGAVRVLGRLAQLADRGIEIHFFTGNHDAVSHRAYVLLDLVCKDLSLSLVCHREICEYLIRYGAVLESQELLEGIGIHEILFRAIKLYLYIFAISGNDGTETERLMSYLKIFKNHINLRFPIYVDRMKLYT